MLSALRFLLSVALSTSNAFEAPRLLVTVDGDCPVQNSVENLLVARGFDVIKEDTSAEYRVEIHGDRGSVELLLSRKDGTRILRRAFTSRDCGAVTDTIVVVLEAQFAEVIAPKSQESALIAPSTETTTKAASPAAAPATSPDATSPDALVANSTDSISAQKSSATTQKTPIRPTLPMTSARQSPPSTRNWYGMLALGPEISLPDREGLPRLVAGFGTENALFPLSVDLNLIGHLPVTTGTRPNRVRRIGSQALIRFGLPLSLPTLFQYRPWLGTGFALTTLKAIDLVKQSTQVSYSPTADFGFDIIYPLVSSIGLQMGAHGTVFLLRDRYEINPDGVVGRGPRVALGLNLGIFWPISRANVRSSKNRTFPSYLSDHEEPVEPR